MVEASAVPSETSPGPTDRLSISDVVSDVWRQRWIGAAILALCLIATVIYLRSATYVFQAELIAVPADQSGSNAGGGLSGLGSLVGIDLGGQEQGPFALFPEAIRSYPVAERLADDPHIMRTIFADSWDVQKKRWRAPSSRGLGQGLKELLGLPVVEWQAPDARHLQAYISEAVVASEDKRRSLITLKYQHPDPKFAAYLLLEVTESADSFLRRKSLERTGTYVNYLEQRLREVQVAEYRQALADAIGTYEKTRMMASSSAPFAAERFGEVWVPSGPTSPQPVMILFLSVVVGVLLWVAYAMLVVPLLSRSLASQH